ncbi:M20 family metallopeptidase [Peribacillus sp. SCS-37]|uniref:M20 family metallopeptidase n=1 Tax=Paraperibacillus esterisolvens TaxID=3115296 RepID=UPI003905D7D0
MSVITSDINRKHILEEIDKNRETYITISHEIHANPEIGNQEYFASGKLISLLEQNGFSIEKDIAGHETGFIARKKSEKEGPSVAFLAEYDALPGLGHACGHNIIGTASTAAAISLSKVIDQTGGEVVVFGTPAEEGGPNGSAKASFAKAGLFSGVDAALMIHPSGKTAPTSPSLAVDPLDFQYYGRPAHAAASPEKGINALDGVILLFNGINALRQQLPGDVRIHGIITHGGEAPNIIPGFASARFFIRASTRKRCEETTEKVRKIAEGAALATGAELKVVQYQNEIDNLIFNKPLNDAISEELAALGENISGSREGIGSTDAGNVSHVIPTVHAYIKIGPDDLTAHTDQFREAAASELGDKSLITAAKALALTGFRLLTEKELLQSVKEAQAEADQ